MIKTNTIDTNSKEMEETNSLVEDNWLDLASHFQTKVNKRTSEVSFLHTKAGFLITAAAVLLQVIVSLPKPTGCLAIVAFIASMILSFLSILISIVSMNMGKASSPLDPDSMILRLTEEPRMARYNFAKWLAKSYAKANEEFNRTYNRKYWLQIVSAGLLLASFFIIVILKGISIYV